MSWRKDRSLWAGEAGETSGRGAEPPFSGRGVASGRSCVGIQKWGRFFRSTKKWQKETEPEPSIENAGPETLHLNRGRTDHSFVGEAK